MTEHDIFILQRTGYVPANAFDKQILGLENRIKELEEQLAKAKHHLAKANKGCRHYSHLYHDALSRERALFNSLFQYVMHYGTQYLK